MLTFNFIDQMIQFANFNHRNKTNDIKHYGN